MNRLAFGLSMAGLPEVTAMCSTMFIMNEARAEDHVLLNNADGTFTRVDPIQSGMNDPGAGRGIAITLVYMCTCPPNPPAKFRNTKPVDQTTCIYACICQNISISCLFLLCSLPPKLP